MQISTLPIVFLLFKNGAPQRFPLSAGYTHRCPLLYPTPDYCCISGDCSLQTIAINNNNRASNMQVCNSSLPPRPREGCLSLVSTEPTRLQVTCISIGTMLARIETNSLTCCLFVHRCRLQRPEAQTRSFPPFYLTFCILSVHAKAWVYPSNKKTSKFASA